MPVGTDTDTIIPLNVYLILNTQSSHDSANKIFKNEMAHSLMVYGDVSLDISF